MFVTHTSASLIITGNKDTDILLDIEHYLQKIVADSDPLYKHNNRRIFDMSGHIRSILTGEYKTIPVTNKQLMLSKLQGLFLYEHRMGNNNRKLIILIIMSSESELSDLIVKAYQYKKNGQFSLAIQTWNTLLKHQAADKDLKANAQLNLGNLHQLEGNNELACKNISNAIKSNPNSAEAYYCLACLEQEKNDFKTAINYFKKSLALNNKSDQGGFNNLGNCYDQINQYAKAIDAYTKAIQIDTHYIAAIYNRGNTYSKIGDNQSAYEDLTKVLKLDSNFYQAYYNRGTLLARMGKLTKSKQDLTKAKVLAQKELKQKTH